MEETLLRGGRGAAVIQQRMEFQELMRDDSSSDRGRDRPAGDRVMSGNQQEPDMMCETFILAPSDLVDEPDELDSPRRPRRSASPSDRPAPPAQHRIADRAFPRFMLRRPSARRYAQTEKGIR